MSTTTLEEFRQNHRLSYAELSSLCGGSASGANRTALRRLCRGQADEELVSRLKPLVDDGLRSFLGRLGHSALPVLEKIWAGTNPASENDQMNVKGEYKKMLPPTTLPFECLQAFGLNGDPFTLQTLPNEIFKSYDLDFIFSGIVRAIQTAGFAAILGETGSGKSVMQTRLAEWSEHPGRKIHLIPFQCEEIESIHPGHISGAILRHFGMTVPRDRKWRSELLARALKSANEQGFKTVVSIDDCHATNRQLVASLKRFNEVGSVGRRFLSILLWGQPQFERRLLDPAHNEIRQRLVILKMPSFSKLGRDYLASRLTMTGGDLNRIFTQDAVDAIASNYTTPLAIQNAAAHALLTTWQRGANQVLPEFVFVPTEPKVKAVRNVAGK